MIVNNVKHEQFCQNKAKGLTHTQSYKDAFGVKKHKSAQDLGYRLMQKPHIKQRIAEILETNKHTTLEHVVNNVAKTANAAQKSIVCDKKVVKVDDERLRHEANKTLLKLHGALDTAGSAQVDNRSVNISIDSKDHDTIANIASTLEAMNRKLLQDKDMQDGELSD